MTPEERTQRARARNAAKLEADEKRRDEMRKREWDSMTKEEQALKRRVDELMAKIRDTYKQARMVRKAATVEVERILQERETMGYEYRPLCARLVELEKQRTESDK